jgi:uncharacterized protein
VDFKSKLLRLANAGPVSPPPASASPNSSGRRARVEQLRGLLATMIADEKNRLRDRVPVPSVRIELPGELLQSAHGAYHRVSNYLEPAHCHGRVPIAGALTASPDTIAKLALDGDLACIDPRRLLFLDTETTGLAGGTGTIPFVIGLAYFEDESLRIEQLVLRQPGEEAPLLHRLAELVERASCLVSYNGKSYDWPLLRTRFVLNRVPVRAPAAHLDLLHCARRIFRRRLGRVRLVHLETEVLGYRREHDIDGAEIPQRFWDFVRGADSSALVPVIEHNANDLVALAAILVTLVSRYEELRPEHEPADRLGVAQVAVRADDHERALLYAEAAAESGGPADVTADALWLAAELARRRHDHRARCVLLLRALETADDEERAARIHLALAKLYEHRLRELERALEHARAIAPAEGSAERDHRVARIERKLSARLLEER